MTSNKSLYTVIGIILAVVVLAGSCSAGILIGWSLPKNWGDTPIASVTSPETSSQQPEGTEELFVPFWEAWQIVKTYYVDQPVDEEIMMRGAIKGMLESLGDQHTSYMDPIQYRDANANLSGEYEGIGAWVSTDGDYLTIVEPMKDSPAQKAGLLPGDQIVAIDGEDMTGIFPELARQRVLGLAGSTVVLTIQRKDLEEPFDVSLQRASIVVASVESEMLEGNIAYIRLRTFGDRTDEDLRAALTDLLAQKPVGLILDLRNNPGGALQTAVQVASEFLKDGVVLYEEYGDGTVETHSVQNGGKATELPLVILVNEFSASASEVVAGSLQDYERGVLVGTQTFGKGSVQQWIPLSNEQGAVRVTIARWLTPNKRQIHEVGLAPDYEVERTDENFQAGLDPQLDKAIEILTQK